MHVKAIRFCIKRLATFQLKMYILPIFWNFCFIQQLGKLNLAKLRNFHSSKAEYFYSKCEATRFFLWIWKPKNSQQCNTKNQRANNKMEKVSMMKLQQFLTTTYKNFDEKLRRISHHVVSTFQKKEHIDVNSTNRVGHLE